MDKKEISFRSSIVYLLVFAILVASIILVLFSFSNNRKEAVYNTYAQETELYIAKNQEGLEKIFNEYMGDYCYQEKWDPEKCNVADETDIPKLLTQDIKDWSSMIFIKDVGRDLYMKRISGQGQEFYVYPQEKYDKVEKLLNGEIEKLPWDEYTSVFSQKEVIIPVKDRNGKVIGALVRGVIE